MEPNAEISARDLIDLLKERIFKEAAMLSPAFRIGCAIGFEDAMGESMIVSKRINPLKPDFWLQAESQYVSYAVYKCITALDKERDTVKRLDPELHWDGAFDPGGCVFYSDAWHVHFAIGISGLLSELDTYIARRLLEKFFQNKE